MNNRDEYVKARKTVEDYEKRITETIQKKCYILFRQRDDFYMVTTDKDYADRLYGGGNDLIMRVSYLCNPKEA